MCVLPYMYCTILKSAQTEGVVREIIIIYIYGVQVVYKGRFAGPQGSAVQPGAAVPGRRRQGHQRLRYANFEATLSVLWGSFGHQVF